MFSGKFFKAASGVILFSALLCSCSWFGRWEENTAPNHSWISGKDYGSRGSSEAELATVAYSQGNFEEAEEHVIQSLARNPRQPQALMVGALLYEKNGRLNRARQYYEDLTIVGTEQMTILGTKDSVPERMSEVARRRLRYLNMMQSDIMIEDKDGVMTFNISQDAAQRQGKSAIEEALFVREQKLVAENKASSQADVKAAEVLFSDGEKNIISRFLTMKELAEKDLITKQEFLDGRQANIGGLLPLTQIPPAAGIDAPVPSPDLIIERINSLKEAEEARAITPQEFLSERDLIVEAILPPNPRQRMKPQAPARDILTAAKDLRKLDVIYDLGLITKSEQATEKQAIEKYLGINRADSKTAPAAEKANSAEAESAAPRNLVIAAPENVQIQTTSSAPQAEVSAKQEELIVPEVSSPF